MTGPANQNGSTTNWKRPPIFHPAFLCLSLSGFLFSIAAEDTGREPLTIAVRTAKAIINWESWNPGHGPLVVQAERDDAIVIFRFKRPPKELKQLDVSSNAAVYVQTGAGLVPITKKAKANPRPFGGSPPSG